ncbi:MAG: electron transfer flavoprotein subunit beta/FixA family protein [Chloroflexi bacterium]|jgi:electron transfer flavoprotein beta subunit|nr:electron transfer flavoprotein subunit beta/FixA family protein [Chloroflexota bacterium]
MLSIIVCVKAVPEPKAAKAIKIDPVTKSLPRLDIPLEINPLDRNALEVALLMKEHSNAHITVISMGPPPAGDIVKECLALGADKGILLSDPAFAGADAYATAYTLAKAIEKVAAVDLVLCGRASSDGSTEWVGPELAVFLDLPVVTMVRELVESEGSSWKVKADLENGYRLVQVELPAVFTVTQDINTPRTLSFSGIIKARKKEITTWGLDDLVLPAESVGLKGSPTIVSKLTYAESKRECQIIEGTLDEKVDILISKLVAAGVI